MCIRDRVYIAGYTPTSEEMMYAFLVEPAQDRHLSSEEGVEVMKELPTSYLRRLRFFSLVHTPGALRALVDAAGADRVLLGTDYPFDMGVDDPIERVREAGLADVDERAILAGNAAGLFPALRHVAEHAS